MKCAAIKNNGSSCTQGISTGKVFTLDSYAYRTCANHFNTITSRINKGATLSHTMFDPKRRTEYSTTAVVGDTTVNLLTDDITEQLTLDGTEEPRDLIIEFPRTISLVAVKENGFKVEGGVKKFYWYRKGRMLVDNDVFLTMLVQKHFATHRNSKYVVITTMGKVVCFKRDLTFATMDNCIVQKSRFVA